MKHTIVAATQNKHKIVEIEAITKEFGMDIILAMKRACRILKS